MNSILRLINKISLLLLIIFVSFSISAEEKSNQLEDFDLPESIGRVTERNIVKDSPLSIIYIQDAHGSYEAQMNIAKILTIIKRNLKTDTVFVEGAEGKLNTDLFSTLGDKETRKEVMDGYVRSARLSGMEYFAIVDNPEAKLYGVEDVNLYLKDKKAFLDVQSLRFVSEVFSREFTKQLNFLRGKAFNPDLNSFFKMHENLDTNDITLLDYIKYVQNLAEIHSIDLSGFPAFQVILKTEDYSKSIDFNEVQKERVSLIRALQKIMEKEDLKTFAVKSIRYRMRELSERKYNQYLLEMAKKHEIDLSSRKEFETYCDYVSLLDDINFDTLMTEVEHISTRIFDALIKNTDERELLSLYKNLKMFSKMMTLELSRGDFYTFRDDPGKYFTEHLENAYMRLANKYGGRKDITDMGVSFDDLTKIVMNFYNLAIERDTIMVDMSVNKMKENDTSIASLVTGGFHKEGIIEQLRDKKISYVVVSPTITEIPSPDLYLSVMRNRMTPLHESLFEAFKENE